MNETAGSSPAPEVWPALALHERRVLGVLIEKAKTTPDAYPLSLNALVTGCNQKSNRDPVLNLSDADAEAALISLQKKGLAVRLTGSGRVERWRHVAYEAWKVEKVGLAILAELLLRGPQPEGELGGRASRMEPIDDLDQLRGILKPLTERRLVVYLTPEGRRGTVLTHGFDAPADLERLRAVHQGAMGEREVGSEPAAERLGREPAAPEWQDRLESAEQEITILKTLVSTLQEQVSALTRELAALKQSLGV